MNYLYNVILLICILICGCVSHKEKEIPSDLLISSAVGENVYLLLSWKEHGSWRFLLFKNGTKLGADEVFNSIHKIMSVDELAKSIALLPRGSGIAWKGEFLNEVPDKVISYPSKDVIDLLRILAERNGVALQPEFTIAE